MSEWSVMDWLVLPALAFALGWLASRIDLRQWRRAQQDSPRAYFKGLNLLLNEQQDKAIDAFIEAVQHDPDTTDLHFALGNLFRRRGEFERSVRVHQHLLARADLSTLDRERAQHALAQDFAKAGLFDRAEEAYRALEGSRFDIEARQALLDLYERSRQWARARTTAEALEASGAGSYAHRRAHHACEEALECLQPTRTDAGMHSDGGWTRASALMEEALRVAPQAARPWVQWGRMLMQQGRIEEALQAWGALLRLPQAPLNLIADDLLAVARQSPAAQAAVLALVDAGYAAHPSLALLLTRNALEPEPAAQRLRQHLSEHPTLSAAAALMRLPAPAWCPDSLPDVQSAIDQGARPLQRYRCAACGFEAQRYFWQCPGCMGWDTYPTQRVEDW